ncbi:MAG: ATP-binding protein [Thermodesulfobacteriota bacterium]
MKPLRSWSLRTLLQLLVLAASLPAMAILLYTGRELESTVTRNAEDFTQSQVRTMAAHHQRVVDNARLLLLTLASTTEVRNMDLAVCQELLDETQRGESAFAALFLADARGRVAVSTSPSGPRDIGSVPYFLRAMEGRGFVTGHYALQEEPRRVILHFAQPVLDPAGRAKGVLVAAFDLNLFGGFFYGAHLPENSVFTLTDARGMRLTRFPETEKYTWVPDLPRMIEFMSGPEEEGTFQEAGVDGALRLYAYKRLRFEGAPFPHLMIRLGIPVDKALSEARRVVFRNGALLLLAALLALALARLLGEFTILRRVRRLVDAAGRLGSGDLSTRTGPGYGEGEFGRLAGAFDSMAEGLERREEARARAEAELQRLNEELEERVARRTEDLAVSNRELQEALEGLRRTQSQLVQAEKMAALGGLVAGVAHEINTPVGVGVTAASLLEEKTRAAAAALESGEMRRSALKEYLDTATEAAGMILGNLRRASDLVRSFKQVAVDQSSQERRTFNVAGYIGEILLSLRPTLKRTGHAVLVDCDPDLRIDSYPGAFSQILTNFIMNSLTHAFAEGAPGEIRIGVSAAGGVLTLVYSDNGRGMTPGERDKAFEPFFTTTRAKGGAGLGLSIVYNLATQTLGGQISCESEPGRGTTFTVAMPLNREAGHERA